MRTFQSFLDGINQTFSNQLLSHMKYTLQDYESMIQELTLLNNSSEVSSIITNFEKNEENYFGFLTFSSKKIEISPIISNLNLILDQKAASIIRQPEISLKKLISSFSKLPKSNVSQLQTNFDKNYGLGACLEVKQNTSLYNKTDTFHSLKLEIDHIKGDLNVYQPHKNLVVVTKYNHLVFLQITPLPKLFSTQGEGPFKISKIKSSPDFKQIKNNAFQIVCVSESYKFHHRKGSYVFIGLSNGVFYIILTSRVYGASSC